MQILSISRIAVLLGSVILLCCSSQQHKAKADTEVYKILKNAESTVFNKNSQFNIKTEYSKLNPSQITNTFIRDRSEMKGSVTMDLDQILTFAAKNSRDFQSRKEQLYLSALSMSDVRHNFKVTGQSGISLDADRDVSNDEIGSLSSNNSLSKLLKSGGSLSLSLANDLLAYFTGNTRKSASSFIQVNILKPLLRGRGSDIAAENLTQSYRNVIYSIRDFNHYQHTFSQDLVVRYFQLLQQQREIANELKNFESRKANTDYLQARAIDRARPQDVTDSEQATLLAKNRTHSQPDV